MAGINHEAVKSGGDIGTHEEWNADHVFTGNSDMEQNQFLNQVIENRTDWPAGPVEGQVIFRTDENKFYVWNGTEWVTFTSPATIVVAADGSGHTTDIQTGINMLPATGGVVYVKEGTYTITSSVTINIDNIAIVGAGRATKIQTINDITMINTNNRNYTFINKIYLYGANGPLGNGINFGQSAYSSITDCWIENSSGHGIRVRAASYSSIINNKITSSNIDGINVIESPVYMIISNNHCYSNTGNGIKIGGGGDNPSRNIMMSNSCIGNGNRGIHIFTGTNNIVVGNVAVNNVTDQIDDDAVGTELGHNITA